MLSRANFPFLISHFSFFSSTFAPAYKQMAG